MFQRIDIVLSEEVPRWVEWAKANLPLNEYPPLVGVLGDECPWNRALLFNADPQELREHFEKALLAAPSDFAPRYVALSVLFLMSRHQDDEEDELELGYLREENDGKRAAFELMFRYFFMTLNVEDCGTWEQIRWEINNSFVAEAFSTTEKLFARAGELDLLQPDRFYGLRGEFRFLRQFGNALESYFSNQTGKVQPGGMTLKSMIWRIGADERMWRVTGALLFTWCLAVPQDAEARFDRVAVLDATSDLTRADEFHWELSRTWPMLARSFVALQDYESAAKYYRLLHEAVAPDAADRSVVEVLAYCLECGGRVAEAITVLSEYADSHRDATGLYLKIAALQCKQANYAAVAESLRAEQDRNPAVDEDWRNSAILALGAVPLLDSGDEHILTAFLGEHPDTIAGIERTITGLWTRFSSLSESCRRRWLFGVFLANFQPGNLPIEPEAQEGAVTAFAKAVEVEMKERVFVPFREFVRHRPDAMNLMIDLAASHGSRREPLAKFVAGPNPRLMLGEMAECFQVISQSTQVLRSWLAPRLTSAQMARIATLLRNLANAAGEAKHEATPHASSTKVQKLAREVLDLIA